MKIDGKAIAQSLLDSLKIRVQKLKEKNITPHMAIILVGDDPASAAYVRQKKLKGESIEAKVTIYNLESTISNEELLKLLEELNNDPLVHGVIVQRPLPPQINSEKISHDTNPQKDIDGFHPQSPYPMPLPLAVLELIKSTHGDGFDKWIQTRNIVVIGKGETGGGPVIELLREKGIEPTVIDSKTTDPNAATKKADIIISTVGKKKVLHPEHLKKDVILIGVGMHKEIDDKLHADYEEEEIEKVASFYTPVPGGVGPVNVAMLLVNLLESAESTASLEE